MQHFGNAASASLCPVERSRGRLYLDRVACLAAAIIGLLISGKAGAGQTVDPAFAAIAGGSAITAGALVGFFVNVAHFRQEEPPAPWRLAWFAVVFTASGILCTIAAYSALPFLIRLALAYVGLLLAIYAGWSAGGRRRRAD